MLNPGSESLSMMSLWVNGFFLSICLNLCVKWIFINGTTLHVGVLGLEFCEREFHVFLLWASGFIWWQQTYCWMSVDRPFRLVNGQLDIHHIHAFTAFHGSGCADLIGESLGQERQ
ncbi:hypothetical protein C163_17495 [Pseudomonas sp. FGI182]|nr:hypothetical protein C163_17495 [Pseudomonas sp. FGI182]